MSSENSSDVLQGNTGFYGHIVYLTGGHYVVLDRKVASVPIAKDQTPENTH